MADNHEPGVGGEEPLLLLEKLLTKFEEDVEAGRVRITVGDLARILTLRDDAEEQTPRTIEVRWIDEDGEVHGNDESDTSR